MRGPRFYFVAFHRKLAASEAYSLKMNLLSWIAKKTGLIVVHVTVVRESHGRIRVIQSTFPHFEYSWIVSQEFSN